MKRMICLCLTLILTLSLVPAQVRAVINSVICYPGNTIDVVLSLAEDGDQPDGVMGQLQYDEHIFILLPSKDVIGMDGINILNRQPVTISFRVNKFAPAGDYTIEARVIEAYDADGKKYTNARINPFQVTVMSASTAAPEYTPAPTPTAKPLLSSAGTWNKQIQAGDYVTFGHYPQTAAGNDQTPIEWLVLEVKDNQVLLLSRYGLEARAYNTSETSVTWESCTLRAWLNKDFLNAAFTAAEQKGIVLTTVDNSESQGYGEYSTNGGNDTQDKIFLLSYAEAYKYFDVTQSDSVNTKAQAEPTMYAISQGAYTNSSNETSDGEAAGWWWLRSPGHYQDYAARVYDDGSLYSRSVSLDSVCVRPALWVDLDAGVF